MKQIFELELWSRPGKLLPKEHGNSLKKVIDESLALPNDIYLGLSFIPSKIDSLNLLHSINEKELNSDEFTLFCKKENLNPSIENNESAAKYLELVYGRSLAWLHIPHDDKGLIYFNSLLSWANDNNYNIQCSHSLYCTVNYNNSEPLNW